MRTKIKYIRVSRKQVMVFVEVDSGYFQEGIVYGSDAELKEFLELNYSEKMASISFAKINMLEIGDTYTNLGV